MSKKLRRRYEAEMANQPLEIKNLLPLMDVIFALLTFFVLSSLFLNRTEGLPVDLPKAQSGVMQKTPARATISVNDKTEIFLNKQKIGITEVSDRVKQLLTPNQDLIVVLNADRSVQHGDVIQIMDQLRQIPRVKMAIARLQALPESEQDAIASMILEEIEDDRRWDKSFSRSPNILAKLAASAMAEYRAGQTQELDPEVL